jgi:hypothetical protein
LPVKLLKTAVDCFCFWHKIIKIKSKNMNKIKSLLKIKYLAVIGVVSGLAIAGVASAALVNYLSNASKTMTSVQSPIVMSVRSGDQSNLTDGVPVLDIGATYGGSSVTFTTIAKNLANNPINGYDVLVVKETDGKSITGNEITTLTYDDNTGISSANIVGNFWVVEADGTLTPLTTFIAAGRSNPTLVLLYDKSQTGNVTQDLSTIPASNVLWNKYTATFSPATVGTYEIYSQYIPDGTTAGLRAYADTQY